jgi:hypothetical protein
MHPHLKRLIELQGVDARILDVRARLAALPRQLAEVEKRVEGARAALAAAKEGLTTSLKERKKYELDVEQWKEKARRYKDQVYEVKTNEAYKALQHEIANAEAEIAKAEDRLLERMVAGEEFERQVKTAEKTLAEVEAAARDDRARIEGEKAAAEKELAALEAEQREVVAAVPEELLDIYRRIARRHGGIALSEVREETCSMCRVRVRPAVYQELRRAESEEIFHCESCTRILYYTEQPVAQAREQ